MNGALRRVLALILLLAVLISAVSCTTPSDPDNTDLPGEDKTYTVTLMLGTGASTDGVNTVQVKSGQTASFNVSISEGYVFSSVSAGTYNHSTGVLTIENITGNMTVYFLTEEYVDEAESFVYVFRRGYDGDTSDVYPALEIPAGTTVNVSATDESRTFAGWTLGASLKGGGVLLSRERDYSFKFTSDIATDGRVELYSNYVNIEANRIYYDPNGGEVDFSSVNMSADSYYTVSEEYGKLCLVYGSAYLDFMESASTFYDDGTFTRDGYILMEYNTEPDGSGTSYSIGSKISLVSDKADHPTLYCIWAKETDGLDFLYEDHYLARPVSEKNAPHWVENGIRITSYIGDDETVVIPETIDGRVVTAIDAGAFVNKSIKTLVMGRRLLRVADGAFVGCSKLETIYFPDGMYEMNNAALDEASYKSLTNFYVNATLAPRFVGADTGALSVKLSRLIAFSDKPKIVIVGGSSSYQGLGTEYLEALLDGEYRVVNFGTTRTTHGHMYLEAISQYVTARDTVIYAPENSSYMFGERELYWKTLRDLESMNNIFRYVDISNYTNVLGAFTDFNQSYRYDEAHYTARAYEDICKNGSLLQGEPYNSGTTNRYGDYLYVKRASVSTSYIDSYYITMNERVKSKYEGWWNDEDFQYDNKDYSDPDNITWASISDGYFAEQMNRAIDAVKASGAKVYFGFCPADKDALVEGADGEEWLDAYDRLIDDIYNFDGRVGDSTDYIWSHEYFYDCAFHLNDYGRTYRTYRLYVDLCKLLDITDIMGLEDAGTDFEGCLFSEGYVDADIAFDGEDANAIYFTYTEMSNGAKAISGLTELGKTMTELTIPLGVGGVKVMSVADNAFVGGVVEKLIITADSNVVLLSNGAFSGASSLKELWIYKMSAYDIMPPADFSYLNSRGFVVYIPRGSEYPTHYYWGERGLEFKTID